MKIIGLLSVLLISSYAVNIQLLPDKNPQITQQDVEALKAYVKEKYHFIMNESGAKRIAKDNRILANEFLKKGLLSPFERNLIRVELEKRLADKMVKNIQKNIKISDDVIRSYYEDHIDEFKEPDKIKIVSHTFDSYEKAIDFYKGNKGNPGKKKDLGIKEVDSLKAPYRGFIEKGKENYCIPPIVLGKKKYNVLCVEKYIDNSSKHIPYPKVKKRIKNILYKKTFSKERAKILEQYK